MKLITDFITKVAKPIEQVLEGIVPTGSLSTIATLVTTVTPIIIKHFGEIHISEVSNTNALQDDSKTIGVLSDLKNNGSVDHLSLEAASYLKSLTNEFHKLNTELGVDRDKLDEYTAIFILERLKCPPKYVDSILKTLRFSKDVKESGILQDASETSKLHNANVKSMVDMSKILHNTDILHSEIQKTMDLGLNIFKTEEGKTLMEMREDQVNKFLEGIKKCKDIDKDYKKITKKLDKTITEEHKTLTDKYVNKYKENIENSYDKDSDEYKFLHGINPL